METIHRLEELHENLTTLEEYMQSNDPVEKAFYIDLIKRGICFVAYKRRGRYLFAPSRFVGYKHNTRHAHLHNDTKDGRKTNPAISNVLHSECKRGKELNRLYERFCSELGFVAKETGSFGVARKFWEI